MSIGSVQPLVTQNPRLGICPGLEAKHRLTDAIAAHDRYMKSSMVDCVSSHQGRDSSWQAQCTAGIVADQCEREYVRDRI
jgi:hypothetical protein